jgi:hypothetical protein
MVASAAASLRPPLAARSAPPLDRRLDPGRLGHPPTIAAQPETGQVWVRTCGRPAAISSSVAPGSCQEVWIHAICRTHPARPVQSAEAAPGAGNKLPWAPRRRNAIRCWAKHAKSHREQIHHRLSSQYAVNGAFTRLMDASHGRVHRYRAKALAHPGIDAGACSTNSVHPDDVGFD